MCVTTMVSKTFLDIMHLYKTLKAFDNFLYIMHFLNPFICSCYPIKCHISNLNSNLWLKDPSQPPPFPMPLKLLILHGEKPNLIALL